MVYKIAGTGEDVLGVFTTGVHTQRRDLFLNSDPIKLLVLEQLFVHPVCIVLEVQLVIVHTKIVFYYYQSPHQDIRDCSRTYFKYISFFWFMLLTNQHKQAFLSRCWQHSKTLVFYCFNSGTDNSPKQMLIILGMAQTQTTTKLKFFKALSLIDGKRQQLREFWLQFWTKLFFKRQNKSNDQSSFLGTIQDWNKSVLIIFFLLFFKTWIIIFQNYVYHPHSDSVKTGKLFCLENFLEHSNLILKNRFLLAQGSRHHEIVIKIFSFEHSPPHHFKFLDLVYGDEICLRNSTLLLQNHQCLPIFEIYVLFLEIGEVSRFKEGKTILGGIIIDIFSFGLQTGRRFTPKIECSRLIYLLMYVFAERFQIKKSLPELNTLLFLGTFLDLVGVVERVKVVLSSQISFHWSFKICG